MQFNRSDVVTDVQLSQSDGKTDITVLWKSDIPLAHLIQVLQESPWVPAIQEFQAPLSLLEFHALPVK